MNETFHRRLFPGITWEIAKSAGRLYNDWRFKGLTLALSDATIAAVALTHKLVLLTDNRKHFPKPELQFYPVR